LTVLVVALGLALLVARPVGAQAAPAPTTTPATPLTAPPTTAPGTGGDDDGGNTWAFVAVGAMLAGLGTLIWRSARRPSPSR
jgi:hypothetical protein